MNTSKFKFHALLALLAAFASLQFVSAATHSTAKVGVQQGGLRMYVASGGELDVESGGALKIAGTAISTTATELNKLYGVTAGTVTASKAVVVDASSKVDVWDPTSLKINGTTVTATAAEINKLAGVTAGTVTASKGVVVDASSKVDVWDPTLLKINGTSISASATEINNVVNGSFCITGTCTETSTANAGALSVATFQSLISSAGAETRTFAAPGGNGILKVIVMTVDGGDVTMLGTNIWSAEAQTCTFDDVGDSLILLSAGGKWVILKATGVTCA
jgi:hypothetical protein